MIKIKELAQFVIKLPSSILGLLFGYDFFISYAHSDGRAYPEKLDEDLRQMGFETHLDTRDYHAGNNLRKLTAVRLRNSRSLILICRPEALSKSAWVRRELDEFHGRGGTLRLINVENAVEAAILKPQENTAAEWLAMPDGTNEQDNRATTLLRIEDRSEEIDTTTRVPGPEVAEALQRAYKDRRRKNVRLQFVAATLALFVCLALALGLTSLIAVDAAGRAEREALVANLQLNAAASEQVAQTPDTQLAIKRILADVKNARDKLGYVPMRTQIALWRILRIVRDKSIWTVNTAQIYAHRWDPVSKTIVTLERDGGVSTYTLEGVRREIIAPTGEDNAVLSFTESGHAIQRQEGSVWNIYSLQGLLIVEHNPDEAEALGLGLRDVSPTKGKLLWSHKSGCIYMEDFNLLPSMQAPLYCAGTDELDLVRFAAEGSEVFLTTTKGEIRKISTLNGKILAENSGAQPFDTWLVRPDARAFIGLRSDRIVTFDQELKTIKNRSLEISNKEQNQTDGITGAALWDANRLLTFSNGKVQPMQLYSLDLELVGDRFRLHGSSSTTISKIPDHEAFVSAGYLDKTVRVFSGKTKVHKVVGNFPNTSFSKIAYCKGSKTLLLGDFSGSVYRLAPNDPNSLSKISLGSEMIDSLACLESERWVATTGGELFSAPAFDAHLVKKIDLKDDIAWKVSAFSNGIVLASAKKVYHTNESAFSGNLQISVDDALKFDCEKCGEDSIFALSTNMEGTVLAIAYNSSSGNSKIVFLDLNSGTIINSRVVEASIIEIPWSVAFSPDGEQTTVSGATLGLESFGRDGTANWSVKGGDEPFTMSLAYIDKNMFVGGGFWGNISLWSADGAVLERDYDADLRRSTISLAHGENGEVYAIDSDGLIKLHIWSLPKLISIAESSLQD